MPVIIWICSFFFKNKKKKNKREREREMSKDGAPLFISILPDRDARPLSRKLYDVHVYDESALSICVCAFRLF